MKSLQGRMATATITTKNVGQTVTRIEQNTYDYDSKGLRISALQEIDSNADATWDERKRTEFLVDHHNHTGYQQVVRETHYNADTDAITKTVDYSFGHDEITQTTREYDAQGVETSDTTLVFGHDGHGSTRVLTDLTASIVEMYMYDAYGQLLAIFDGTGTLTSGGNASYADASTALTNLLYSGEQFDTRIGQQYLRARYYDPATGTFNRLDPFFGRTGNPQSFNKYLYAQGDPVMMTDPTGLEGLISSLGTIAVRMTLGALSGGVIGGIYGGIDAKSGGGSFWAGFVDGAIVGALFGAAAGVLGPLFAAGIAAAKEHGVYAGRKPGTTKANPESVKELREKGLTALEIARFMGVSQLTVYRYRSRVVVTSCRDLFCCESLCSIYH